MDRRGDRVKRWHHGHSLGAGIAFGLILSRRPELVFAAGLAAGVAGHPVHAFCENDAGEWAALSAAAIHTPADPGFTYPLGPPVIYLAPLVCGDLHALLRPGGADTLGPWRASFSVLTFV